MTENFIGGLGAYILEDWQIRNQDGSFPPPRGNDEFSMIRQPAIPSESLARCHLRLFSGR